MRIIDEKGRLFGKINVIDFGVIFLIFCLIPVFYLGHNILNRPNKAGEFGEFIEIEVDCKVIKMLPETLKLMQVGDKEVDAEGIQIGALTSLGKIQPYQRQFDLDGGKIIIENDEILKEVYAKMLLRVKIEGENIYYKNTQIKSNSPFNFITNKYSVVIIPITVTGDEIDEVNIALPITMRGLSEDVLKLISVGDKEIDAQGRVIAEVVEVGKLENETREIPLGDNKTIITEDATKKQVNLKMRLSGQIMKNNKLYFKGQLIEQKSLVEFKTDKYTLRGVIAVVPKEIWIQAKVKFTGLIHELTRLITIGDIQRDFMGRTVGVLTNIINIKPSETFILKGNRFVTATSPYQKDMDAVLSFMCIEKGGLLYFGDYSLSVGNAVTFKTDRYTITGTIIDLQKE